MSFLDQPWDFNSATWTRARHQCIDSMREKKATTWATRASSILPFVLFHTRGGSARAGRLRRGGARAGAAGTAEEAVADFAASLAVRCRWRGASLAPKGGAFPAPPAEACESVATAAGGWLDESIAQAGRCLTKPDVAGSARAASSFAFRRRNARGPKGRAFPATPGEACEPVAAARNVDAARELECPAALAGRFLSGGSAFDWLAPPAAVAFETPWAARTGFALDLANFVLAELPSMPRVRGAGCAGSTPERRAGAAAASAAGGGEAKR